MTYTSIWHGVLTGATWLLALAWLWQWLQWSRHLQDLPDLTRRSPGLLPSPPVGLPHLTVIVPACNEQASIAATLRSLLNSQGIRLQVIAVNDRSTDRTGDIMDGIATEWGSDSSPSIGRELHTLSVIHIGELPPEWLGKPHAMATGADLSRADWLLFTDGDILFAPQALALALEFAQSEAADHLVLLPDWTTKSFGEAAMHGAIQALSCWSVKLWRVANPHARDFLGVGAFNLVRRSTYQAVGGFTSLRMEVLEDLRLGWKIKRAGFRQSVALGPRLVSVRWAVGALGVVRNLEKNLFALYRYNTPIAIGACVGLACHIVGPFLTLMAGGWGIVAVVFLYGAIAGLYGANRRLTRISPIYAVVFPLAVSIFLFAHLRSVFLALYRGGIVWRGTLYRLKDLRAYSGGFW